jgi:hypothetical protein
MENNNNSKTSQPLKQPIQVPRWKPSFAIVGLNGVNSGQCCCQHVGCEKYLEVGDICPVLATQVRIEHSVENAIKLVKIADGMESCIVGYVPRAYVKNAQVKNTLKRIR